MPRYSYRCTDCQGAVEVEQTVAEMRARRDQLRCARCEGRMQFVFPVPYLSTNKTFLAGRGDGFGNDDRTRKIRYAEAKRNGVSTAGKIWSPQLNTWIDGKDDVKRICQERNLDCDGVVTHKAVQLDPHEDNRYQVADDIVDAEVDRIAEERGRPITGKELPSLREETQERLSGKQD